MERAFRILRLAPLHYSACIHEVLLKYPNFSSLSYERQKECFFSEFYNYGNSFSHEMKLLGHEAEEIVYDFEIMQKTWAQEKGFLGDMTAILLAQIQEFNPEILYLQDIHCLPHEIRNSLKERFPFLRLVIIFRGFPGGGKDLLPHLKKCDLLLVGTPHLQKLCNESGIKSHLVYHYFDERILERLRVKTSCDFSFVGSSGYGYGYGHADRYWMLKELLEKTNLSLWIDEIKIERTFLQKVRNGVKKVLLEMAARMPQEALQKGKKHHHFFNEAILKKEANAADIKMPKVLLKDLYPDRCHKPLFGLSMYEKIAESKISLNRHSNAAKGTVDNIRLFQVTGVGSCLLTDSGSNMSDLFEPGYEIVTYNSLKECQDLVHELLRDEKMRKEIALNGQKRVLKQHTAKVRIREINELIQREVK